MRITALVATLMLGGIGCAYAQGGPSEEMRGGSDRGSPSMQESGAGPDSTSNRSPQGQEKSGARAPGEGSTKARSAEKSESSSGKSEERGNKARSAEEKSDTKRATKSDDSSTSSRQASPDDTKDATEKSSDQADKPDTSKKAAGDSRDEADRTAGDTAGAKDTQKTAGDKASTDSAKRVDLSGDKRTRVQTAFKGVGDVKHRTDVNINIAVGTRLPRDWDFVPVPIAVVEIVPEYRDYVFVYVDDQYVICDPVTYEVVAVLPAERGYAGGSPGGGKCSSQLSLNADERKLILQSVSRGREVNIDDLSIGRRVPQDIDLLIFPESVISEASELRSCRYFDAGDQIAIVDPDEDKIVLIIDKS